jgi:hypothetical protein
LSVTANRGLIEAPSPYSYRGVAVTLLKYGGKPKRRRQENRSGGGYTKPVTRVETVQSGKLAFGQKDNCEVASG